MWFQKHKWKILVPLLLLVVLAGTFYFGGSAPGSRGWEIPGSVPTVSAAPVVSPTPAPVDPTPAVSATPENTPTPEQTVPPEQTATPSQASELPPAPTATPTPPPDSPPVSPQPTMEIDPETGKDKYLTDPVPEGKPIPVEPQDVTIGTTAYTCTLSINCSTILDNLDLCDPEKADLVPEDGWILQPLTVTFYEGESVFNVLQRVCKRQKIHMEFENTPIYNSAYIEGIHNLYEFDVGELSGWMYQVNEWFPNYGCSRYQLKDGDVIDWVYTCDLGKDVGGRNAIGG